MAFSARTLAFSDPITVTSETDAVHFPKYIDFTLSANDSESSITHATIYITFRERPYGTSTPHDVSIQNPARTISLQWYEDTSGGNFHTPGTAVEYYWVLQDSTGHQHTQLPQDFTTIDTRFSWQHLSQGLMQVNWYNGSQDFGYALLERANTSLAHITQMLGGEPFHSINVWVYASNDDFHGALRPGSYEWVGGEAYPWLNETFISADSVNDDTLIRDLPHELTHLVFHQLTAQGPIAPVWFDEGLAVYNQFYHEPEMKYRFTQALASHSLLRLDDIADRFPAESDQAYLAYAQSWNLIDYMYSTFGLAKMALLIQKMNYSQFDFNQALTQVLSVDTIHLENQWRLHLNQPSILTPDEITPTPKPTVQTPKLQPSTPIDNTAPVFITLGTLLIVLPIVGVVVFLIMQRRKQEQALAVQAAENFLATNTMYRQPGSAPGYGGPMGYTPPQQSTAGQYIPYTTPTQAFGGPPVLPLQPPQTPAPSPAQPGIQWQSDYPSMDYPSADEGNGENKEATPAPFVPFQENINNVNQQPRKSAPQE